LFEWINVRDVPATFGPSGVGVFATQGPPQPSRESATLRV
jgi:hypothetical protein